MRSHPGRAAQARDPARRLQRAFHPSRLRDRARVGRSQPLLAPVPPFASRRDPGVRFLHRRDGAAEDVLRPVLHRASHPEVFVTGATAHPDSAWVTQQARNLAIDAKLEGVQFLIHDRDAKFSGQFDQVFRTEGVHVIRTPIRAPRANAVAERWVGTVRRDCLDHVLIFGRRHVDTVLEAYLAHYNGARPHRALELGSPTRSCPPREPVNLKKLRRRDILGGVIHEYEGAAA